MVNSFLLEAAERKLWVSDQVQTVPAEESEGLFNRIMHLGFVSIAFTATPGEMPGIADPIIIDNRLKHSDVGLRLNEAGKWIHCIDASDGESHKAGDEASLWRRAVVYSQIALRRAKSIED
jgi:hypothetical protein